MEILAFATIIGACLVSIVTINKLLVAIDGYRFSKAHSCEEPIKLPQSERIIGYQDFKEQMVSSKANMTLPAGLKRFREIGNTFSVVTLGRKLIVTIEPENIKSILAINFKDFGVGRRLNALGALLGRGIFTSDGLHWEHSRALVRPSFTKHQIADLSIFETHIQQLLLKIPHDGSPVDLQPLFFQFTLDSATEFLLGKSVNALHSSPGSEEQRFGQAFDYAQTELIYRLKLGPFLSFYRNKKFDDACKYVHKFIDKFVTSALEFRQEYETSKLSQKTGKSHDEKGKYIFANELALATNDPIQIRSELLNILLAGRDTTAGLLSNTFFILARHPDIWAKLKVEVDQLNGKKPDYETLRNLKYLKQILNESLRLYPSLPLNARVALRNTTIPVGGGPSGKSPIFIPKGGMVFYSTYAMHRRRDLYGEDADEYRPERWEKLHVGWEYLPFNGGPRMCIGQQFALTEAGYTIVRLIQEFKRIESRDPMEWCESLHLTLSSGNGVHVALFSET